MDPEEAHLRRLEDEWLERVRRAAFDVDAFPSMVLDLETIVERERNLRLIEKLRREAEEKRNTL